MTATRILSVGVVLLCSGSIACTDNTAPDPAASAVVGAISATKLSGTVRTAVDPSPAVVVKDRSGNPLPGLRVVFYVAGGGGTVTPGVAVTDQNGVARVDAWVLGQHASATASGKESPNELWAIETKTTMHVTFTAEALPGPPLFITSKEIPGERLVSGWPLTVDITVFDANGNFISRVPVAFAVADGGGSLSADTAVTDASGHVLIDWTLGAPGVNEATATVAGLPPLTLTATSLDPASYTWYDLQPIEGRCGEAVRSSVIGLGAGGEMIARTEYADVDRVTVFGQYAIAGTSIWMNTGTIEIGAFDGDGISLSRSSCDDDLSSESWVYRKRGTASP